MIFTSKIKLYQIMTSRPLFSLIIRSNVKQLQCSYFAKQWKPISTNVNSPLFKKETRETHTTTIIQAPEPPTEPTSWFGKQMKNAFDKITKRELKSAGFVLCTNCTTGVNYKDFVEYFDMPDTFYSWFLITELHIWMISNR